METTISSIDFVIVHCGYTSRLIKHINAIEEYIDEEGLEMKMMYIYDQNKLTVLNQKAFSKYQKIFDPKEYGTIGFTCSSLGYAFNICEHLMTYEHCACFSMSNIYDMNYKMIKDKKILKISFDTESG